MARPALRIQLSTKDQKELQGLLGGGVQQVRMVLRALALLQLAKGVSARPYLGDDSAHPAGDSEHRPPVSGWWFGTGIV